MVGIYFKPIRYLIYISADVDLISGFLRNPMKSSVLYAVPLAFVLGPGAAAAETTVKIGVLSDMSGVNADISGPGSVEAAKMAVADFDPAKHEMKVDIISADHQNNPDVGSGIARQWYEVDHINAIADVPNSGVALAVSGVTREKNKVLLISGAADSDLTDKSCSPNTVHWTYDTWALAHGTGSAIVKNGGTTWFFITADYAFGHALERDTTAVVKAAGGQVLGSARVPKNALDFSSYLRQARASGAKVIGLANSGGDTTNSVKQAAEFGIVTGGQPLAGLLVFLSDVHALGLQVAQGLMLTTAFYWDLNDQTRAFAKSFAARNGGKYPTMVQAGVYSSVLHYLQAVEKVGSPEDGAKIVEAMKATQYDDPLFGPTQVRVDGRAIHAMYLMEVKKPSESKGPYDYFKLFTKIPANEAFRPLSEEKGRCSLVPNVVQSNGIAANSRSNPSLENELKTGQVRREYVEPTNAMEDDIHDRLQAMHVLERLSEFLRPLRLPRPLTLKVQGCNGRINAYYWNDAVIVCYEYFDFLLRTAPQQPTPEGLTRREALAGMTADVFLHETGHAVFDMLETPFLGREEDAADEFSAYMILQLAKDSARSLILGVAYLGSAQAQQEMKTVPQLSQFADVHELPAQRYFNVLCMAYGDDPNLFADAVQHWHLPETRAKNCHYEYLRFQYAFRTLINPYLDQELCDEVIAKGGLAFGPEADSALWR
jgi:branched-chain amino acid transport system substrate-binding protein